MRHLTTHRAAGVLAAVLTATLLPLLAPATPADAADPCLSEAQPTIPGTPLPSGAACDDTVPPTTAIVARVPQPVGGWIRSTSIEIRFSGDHPDADTDPIGYECQFFNTPSAPTAWEACTSPFRTSNLDGNTATPYVFRVRAVDTTDDAHDITADPFFPAGADTPDYDQSPAELVFRVDATAPSTFGFLLSSFYDQAQQDQPMVDAQQVRIQLQSDEGDDDHPVRYQCRLNGKPVACKDGVTTLGDLRAGLQRFSAAAVDPAGNVDPTPFTQQFFVPRNLTAGNAVRASKGDWRKVRSPGAFGGDYLQTTIRGATLSFPVRDVREIRLLAPAGPGLGRVEIRVGRGMWLPVDLSSNDPRGLKVYQVRDQFSGPLTGPLQIRVVSRGKPVRVDALSAR